MRECVGCRVRFAARHALPVRFLLQAKRAHNRQQSPTTAASSFYHLRKPATTLGRRAAKGGKNLNYQDRFCHFYAILQWQKQSQRVCHGGYNSAAHTRGREEQVSMTATQPHCKPEACSAYETTNNNTQKTKTRQPLLFFVSEGKILFLNHKVEGLNVFPVQNIHTL